MVTYDPAQQSDLSRAYDRIADAAALPWSDLLARAGAADEEWSRQQRERKRKKGRGEACEV